MEGRTMQEERMKRRRTVTQQYLAGYAQRSAWVEDMRGRPSVFHSQEEGAEPQPEEEAVTDVSYFGGADDGEPYSYEDQNEVSGGEEEHGGITYEKSKGMDVVIITNPLDSNAHERLCIKCNMKDAHHPQFGRFILCGNHLCKTGGHVSCLGLDQVPEYQWFCNQCRRNGVCAGCNKRVMNTNVVACAFCNCFGHEACLARWHKRRPFRTSWRCHYCICRICRKQDDPDIEDEEDDEDGLKRYFQCKGCKYLSHKRCIEMKFPHLYCFSYCPKCLAGEIVDPDEEERPVDSDEEEPPVDSDDEPREAEEDHGTTNDAPLNTDESESESEEDDLAALLLYQAERTLIHRGAATYHRLIERIQALQRENPQKSIVYYLNAKHDVPADTVLNGLIENAIESAVSKRTPAIIRAADIPITEEIGRILSGNLGIGNVPKKLGRAISADLPVCTKEYEVSCAFAELTVRGTLVYRPIEDVCEQLYGSPSNRDKIPFRRFSDGSCASSGSGWGSAIDDLVYAFRNRRKDIHPDDEVLVLQIFSDGTSTNFVNLHPVLVTLANFEHPGIVLNQRTAYSFFAMIPTELNLRFYDSSGHELSLSEGRAMLDSSKITLSSVQRDILRESLRYLLNTELPKLEMGIEVCDGEGSIRKVYGILGRWICDLVEKRDILGLALSPHFVCPTCFDRPVVTSKACPVKKLDALTKNSRRRSFTTIGDLSKLSNKVKEGTEQMVGKEKWSFEQRFGFAFPEKSVLRQTESFFLMKGAPWYMPFDRLHVVDGILARLWKYTLKFYGPSFGKITQEYGNIHLGVASLKRFHKMEEALHDVQYVLVALVLRPTIKQSKHLMDRRGAHAALFASFVLIVVCLKDEAPFLVKEDLRLGLHVFRSEFSRLFNDVQPSGPNDDVPSKSETDDVEEGQPETCKMHILFQHSLEDLEDHGPPGQYSTDVCEYLMPSAKRYMVKGSRRRHEHQKTVLEQHCREAAYIDAEYVSNRPIGFMSYERNEPYSAVPSMRVISASTDPGPDKLEAHRAAQFVNVRFNQQLREEIIRARIEEMGQELVNRGCIRFGRKVEASLRCSVRNTSIKSPFTISCWSSRYYNEDMMSEMVARTRLFERVMAFSNEDKGERNEKRGSSDSSRCCRMHSDAELHCSFARLQSQSTKYGIPLFFAETEQSEVYAIVWYLNHAESERLSLDSLFGCDSSDPELREKGEEVFQKVVLRLKPSSADAEPNIGIINLRSQLRTTCFAFKDRLQSSLLILRCGIRSFKHLQ